jgi:hypothetical protein
VQRGLDDVPRTTLVTLDETVDEPTGLPRPVGPTSAARRCGTVGRTGEERVHVTSSHRPTLGPSRSRESAGADVAVRGHVVHAESIGGLLEGELAV